MIERKAFQYIIEVVMPDLQKHGVELYLEFSENHVTTDEVACSGFFDPVNKVLACAVGTKKLEDWFGTFLHEYSHFQQWIEKCPAWIACMPTPESNSDVLLDRYLKGEYIEGIEEILKNIAFLEYDCEIRASKKLHKFPEIFDIPTYIQKANAYIAFYRQICDLGKWYDSERAPYLNEDIYTHMPSEFMPFENYFEDYHFDYIDWTLCLPVEKERSQAW